MISVVILNTGSKVLLTAAVRVPLDSWNEGGKKLGRLSFEAFSGKK